VNAPDQEESMKALAIITIALAVLVGAVAYVYNCQHDGKAMTLANGRQVPMKCFWTAMAEIGVAGSLLVLGGLQLRSRQRETHRALGVMGGVLGAVVILIPTVLIGVCAHPDASCNLIMRPAMIFMGILLIAAGTARAVLAPRLTEQAG
jgi:Domain of unknown function (DUF4418)